MENNTKQIVGTEEVAKNENILVKAGHYVVKNIVPIAIGAVGTAVTVMVTIMVTSLVESNADDEADVEVEVTTTVE